MKLLHRSAILNDRLVVGISPRQFGCCMVLLGCGAGMFEYHHRRAHQSIEFDRKAKAENSKC